MPQKFRIGDIVRANCCENTTHWKITDRHSKALPNRYYGVVTSGIGKGSTMSGWADKLVLVRRRRKKK